jgi:hypothetical protein
MIVGYTHDEYCDMPSSFGTGYSRAGNATRFVIVVEFMKALICSDDWSSVSVRQELLTPTVHLNSGRPWTVRIAANAAGKRDPWRSSENWDHPNRGSSKC